jgi:hypothetical protein
MWGDDWLHSNFCLSYSQISHMLDDDEAKNDFFENDGDLKKCQTVSIFAPYMGLL